MRCRELALVLAVSAAVVQWGALAKETLNRNTTDCFFDIPPDLAERYPWAQPRKDSSSFFCNSNALFRMERNAAREERTQWVLQLGEAGGEQLQEGTAAIHAARPDGDDGGDQQQEPHHHLLHQDQEQQREQQEGQRQQQEKGEQQEGEQRRQQKNEEGERRQQGEGKGEDREQPDHFEGPGYGLVWYGDSVIQCFRWPFKHCWGAPDVMARHVGKYKPAVWALGNDKTTSLLWRMWDGVAPQGIGARATVTLIGMNDLSRWANDHYDTLAQAPATIGSHMVDIAEYQAAQQPGVHVIMMAMLPRGWGSTGYEWPNEFTPLIQEINGLLKAGLERLNATHTQNRFYYLDCGPVVLPQAFAPSAAERADEGQVLVPKELMADGMHLSSHGFNLMFKFCLNPLLERVYGY